LVVNNKYNHLNSFRNWEFGRVGIKFGSISDEIKGCQGKKISAAAGNSKSRII